MTMDKCRAIQNLTRIQSSLGQNLDE